MPAAPPDEVVGEILPRLLPDGPVCLFRASMARRTWSHKRLAPGIPTPPPRAPPGSSPRSASSATGPTSATPASSPPLPRPSPSSPRSAPLPLQGQVSALLHVHGDSASIVEPRPDSVRPTRQVLEARMLSRTGTLSTPLNPSATTSRPGLLVMVKVLSRVLARSTNMDGPCYPKILLVMFLRGHLMKNRRRVQPAKIMPGTRRPLIAMLMVLHLRRRLVSFSIQLKEVL